MTTYFCRDYKFVFYFSWLMCFYVYNLKCYFSKWPSSLLFGHLFFCCIIFEVIELFCWLSFGWLWCIYNIFSLEYALLGNWLVQYRSLSISRSLFFIELTHKWHPIARPLRGEVWSDFVSENLLGAVSSCMHRRSILDHDISRVCSTNT